MRQLRAALLFLSAGSHASQPSGAGQWSDVGGVRGPSCSPSSYGPDLGAYYPVTIVQCPGNEPRPFCAGSDACFAPGAFFGIRVLPPLCAISASVLLSELGCCHRSGGGSVAFFLCNVPRGGLTVVDRRRWRGLPELILCTHEVIFARGLLLDFRSWTVAECALCGEAAEHQAIFLELAGPSCFARPGAGGTGWRGHRKGCAPSVSQPSGPKRRMAAPSGAAIGNTDSAVALQFPVALDTSTVTPGPIVELTAIFFM